MEKEIVLGGKKYISAKRVSEKYGYNKDYIGQICRGSDVDAKMIGRNWFVNEEAIIKHFGFSDGGTKKSLGLFFVFLGIFYVFVSINLLNFKFPQIADSLDGFGDKILVNTLSAFSTVEDVADAIVVAPSTDDIGQDFKIREYIKKSFSDEVEVVMDGDSSTGVIKPIFRQTEYGDVKKDQKYLYVLVPLIDRR